MNEKTSSGINFFGQVELWQICESQIAPKFNLVSQPNSYVKTSTTENGTLMETQQLQYRDFMEKNSSIRCQKPYSQNWIYHSIGSTGFAFASVASLWNSVANNWTSEIRVQLETYGASSKQSYAALEQKKEEFERVFGMPLTWYNPKNAKTCRIYVRRDAKIKNEQRWPEQFHWLKENLERFQMVFMPVIQSANAGDNSFAAKA